jgi:hypothetical protein
MVTIAIFSGVTNVQALMAIALVSLGSQAFPLLALQNDTFGKSSAIVATLLHSLVGVCMCRVQFVYGIWCL